MHTFEVELQGRLGYTLTATINAERIGQAEFIVARRFPELTVTGNTRDMGEVPANVYALHPHRAA
jgi:hypothetical protein